MILHSLQDRLGLWPISVVSLAMLYLVPQLGHVRIALSGVEETLSVQVSSLIYCS